MLKGRLPKDRWKRLMKCVRDSFVACPSKLCKFHVESTLWTTEEKSFRERKKEKK